MSLTEDSCVTEPPWGGDQRCAADRHKVAELIGDGGRRPPETPVEHVGNLAHRQVTDSGLKIAPLVRMTDGTGLCVYLRV